MLREIKTDYHHYFIDENRCLQGEYKEWSDTGTLITQCYYKDGKYHGEYKSWWDNGQLAEHSFQVNDNIHGECKWWDKNGNLSTHCFYKNGECHGECKEWWSGKLHIHCFYVNGCPVGFDEIPYPSTPEDCLYIMLKYDLQLLPVENVC